MEEERLEGRLEELGYDGIAPNFRSLMELGAPPEADYLRVLRLIEAGLRARPRSARLHALKGKVLSNLSRHDEALESLDLSLRLDEGQGRAWAWRGAAALLSGRVAEAVTALGRAIELDPACDWAYFHRAAGRFALGDAAAARGDLERLLADPRQGEAGDAARAFLALLEAREGRLGAGLALADEAVARRGAEGWPHLVRARLLEAKGEKARALQDLDSALARGLGGWARAERARLREETGNASGALSDVEAALAESEDPALLARSAKLKAALGRWPGAVADARRLIARGGPEARGPSLELAELLERSGRPAEAQAVLKAALRRYPDDAELAGFQARSRDGARWNLFEDLLRRGRLHEARARALALPRGESSDEVLRKLGEVMTAQGRHEDAALLLAAAAARRPRAPELLRELFAARLRAGLLDEARASLERLTRLAPSSSEAHKLAEALVGRCRAAEAEAVLRRALRGEPGAEPLRALQAELLLKAGRPQEAEAALSRGLALRPRSEPLRALLREALDALLSEAHFLMGQDRFREAEAPLRRRLVRLPRDFETLFAWGKLMRFQVRLREAESAYRAACALRPGALEPRLYRAEALMRGGKAAAGLALLKRAGRLRPEPPVEDERGWVLRYRRAACALELAQAERIGEFLLDRSRRRETVEGMTWHIFLEDFELFARPRAYLERLTAALDAFARARPGSPWPSYLRVVCTLNTPGLVDGTDEDVRALRAADPARYGWMRFAAGMLCLKGGDAAAAARDFSAAAAFTEPRDWKGEAFAGAALLSLGEGAEAVRALESAARLAPPGRAAVLARWLDAARQARRPDPGWAGRALSGPADWKL